MWQGNENSHMHNTLVPPNGMHLSVYNYNIYWVTPNVFSWGMIHNTKSIPVLTYYSFSGSSGGRTGRLSRRGLKMVCSRVKRLTTWMTSCKGQEDGESGHDDGDTESLGAASPDKICRRERDKAASLRWKLSGQ